MAGLVPLYVCVLCSCGCNHRERKVMENKGVVMRGVYADVVHWLIEGSLVFATIEKERRMRYCDISVVFVLLAGLGP
jgi:hypothetical protein